MCLFHKLFVRHKHMLNKASESNVNPDNLSMYNITMGCSEVAIKNDPVEEKEPLDQQIRKANEKKGTSEDNTDCGDSVRDIGPRIPTTVRPISEDR